MQLDDRRYIPLLPLQSLIACQVYFNEFLDDLSSFPSYLFSLLLSVVCLKPKSYLLLFKKILFIYLFLERGEGKEKDREGNINVWLLLTHPHAGDLVCNLGFCPDWESNQRPFGSQAGTQSTDAHQPGVICHFFIQNPSVTPTSSESISIP